MKLKKITDRNELKYGSQYLIKENRESDFKLCYWKDGKSGPFPSGHDLFFEPCYAGEDYMVSFEDLTLIYEIVE